MRPVACAVVSGASSGIGSACAAALRSRDLAVVGIDLRACDDVDLAIEADVSDPLAMEQAVAAAEDRFGAVAHLVTAAGYYERRPLGAIGPAHWRRMVDVILGGTVNLCRAAYARMRQRGAGGICTIGSELGLTGDPDAVHYAAAKGALHAFTKSLAAEAAPHGVRVNCVAPGPTDTPLMTPELRDPAYVDGLVLGRLVSPSEVAASVSFVLMGEHSLVGQVVSPNAGAVI